MAHPTGSHHHARARIVRGLLTLAAAIALVCVPAPSMLAAAPQHDGHETLPGFDAPIRLYTAALGKFTRPISSRNAEAQAYFSQGFQLMYAFARVEAVRSFREAQRRDRNCAICFWGEAWAWGSYVNARMTPQEAPHAYAAAQKALALADAHASAEEQAFIRAMAVRYVEHYDPANRGAQDAAYADAMGRVAAAYPDDLDAATLYAESLFLLLPRPRLFDADDPAIARVLGVLEGALRRDIRHAGACHLYVHTTELTNHPEKAEACVEFLGSSMPGASHINHMPAHTWTRVGRWGDAVRASLDAWSSDQKAASGDAIVTYPAHDLQMLAYAASMDGQGALAIQAGRGFAKVTGDPTYAALTLVRFGRFDEISGIGARPAEPIAAGVWEFAQGYAQLRRGDTPAAARTLERLMTTAATSTASFKFHPAKALLGTLGGILEGEVRRASGDLPAAITSFERAVSLQDSLIVDDPEPLPIAARHWLGAALLDAKRFADAERVYRDDLERHPHNGWSLIGWQQALDAQHKPSGAVTAEMRASWARSDTPIRASRF